jgi:diaminopimelate decarboxylase
VHFFDYNAKRELCCEGVPLERIAREVGTPTYVYSARTIRRHYRVVDRAFRGVPHLLCYSVKACSNLGVLALLVREGSGFDVVSGGELHRVLAAGGDPKKTVFSGVGKTEEEMAFALREGILLFNVESEEELESLARTAARLRRTARITLRVNPAVDAKTHPYIATGLRESKFGIPMAQALRVARKALKLRALDLAGLDVHIGSQLTATAPFVAALEKVRGLIEQLRAEGAKLRYLDVGGGLGITYNDEQPPAPREYATAVARATRGLGLTLILEPGRVIMGNAGVLLTRVLYRKRGEAKSFLVVDAAMNDLVRPALYGAHHRIQEVRLRGVPRRIRVDVVGPVCESADFLAKDRLLTDLKGGDLLAVMSAGAYGFSMSSNYNSRPRAAEVLVDGRRSTVVRARETLEDLVRGERLD